LVGKSQGSHGQPAALEALECSPSTDSEKHYFGDFSKMGPSSRFGLAMAVPRDCPLMTIFQFKKFPFLDAHFPPFQESFGPRLSSATGSMNLLFSGYTPFTSTMDLKLLKIRFLIIVLASDTR
jgi:hypothetical protein